MTSYSLSLSLLNYHSFNVFASLVAFKFSFLPLAKKRAFKHLTEDYSEEDGV